MVKASTRTSSQKHARLKEMAKEAKRNIYDMLRLVHEILEDHEYVDTFGGELPLLEMLEQDEFSHFGGQPALAEMVRAYRHSPLKETWEEYRYNIRVMIDLATPERTNATGGTHINWKKRCAELEEKIAQLQAENAMLKELIVGQRVGAA